MSVSTFLEARALYYRVEANGSRGDYRSFYVRSRQLYMGLIVSAEAAAVPAIVAIQSCVQEFLVPHLGVQNAWQRQQTRELPAPVREDDISPDFYEDIVMLEPELLGDGIRFGADFDYQMTQTLVPNRLQRTLLALFETRDLFSATLWLLWVFKITLQILWYV